jgi:hypothetical protein
VNLKPSGRAIFRTRPVFISLRERPVEKLRTCRLLNEGVIRIPAILRMGSER